MHDDVVTHLLNVLHLKWNGAFVWVRTGGFARCAKIYPALSYVWYIFFARVRQFSELCPMCIFLLCLHWLYVNFGDLVNMEVQSRSCLDSFWCWCVHSLSLRVRLFLLTRSHYIRVSCSCKKKRMQLRLLKILSLDARVHSKKSKFWEQQSLRCWSNNSSILTSYHLIDSLHILHMQRYVLLKMTRNVRPMPRWRNNKETFFELSWAYIFTYIRS